MAIERLPEGKLPRITEENVRREKEKSKRFMKGFLNNAGIFVGVLITFAVVVIVTTDIHLASVDDLSSLGIDFFLLLLCTYSMHVACSDSGMRAGLSTESYIKVCDRYESKKKNLIDNGYQKGLYAFCRHYIAEELKNARLNVIVLVGFTYDDYMKNWVNLDEDAINASEDLTEAQKKAIIKANKIKPISLLPEMFMRMGRKEGRREPLGTDPKTKKNIHFGVKLNTMIALSLTITMIAFDVVKEPSFAMFATALVKLIVVVFNGFTGYKFGYENIVIDSVEYISDQTDLIDEATKYFEQIYGVETNQTL